MCSGCNTVVSDLQFMECSRINCKKKFHQTCLALTMQDAETFTPEYKNLWICPECTCAMPKRGNKDTPVRGTTVTSKVFSPSNYVNTAERGSRWNTSEEIDTESLLRDELREFRGEVKFYLEEQRKEYILMRNRFVNTETELKEVKEMLGVVQQKANKVDILEARIKTLMDRNETLEDSLKKSQAKVSSNIEQSSSMLTPSFASIVIDKHKRVVGNNGPAKEFVATKTAKVVSKEKQMPVVNNDKSGNVLIEKKEDLGKEVNWTTVARKKSRHSNSEVKKGGNTSAMDIQGTEKKRYLHVWRLQKQTTVESLEKYVRNIYNEEVQIKVEKIKHRTERDYASFIVGVPESKYEKLCQPESWAVNIEFAEWVWFRRPINNPRNPE